MRALFFAPHAGIWVHAFPEALIADALGDSGIDIVYVTCGGALSSLCITMASRGVAIDSPVAAKQAVCRECMRNRDLLRADFDFKGYDFESVLTPVDERRIEELTARPRAVATFDLDGVAVGRAALYEYLISKKKSQLEIPDEEWPEFRPRLANTVRSLLAAQKILDLERPDRVLTYNSLYSVNAMWRAAADQRGIASYFLHAGSNLRNRLQTMMLGRDSSLRWYAHLIEAWRDYRDLPCSAGELAAVTDHFEQLLRGTSVFAYSAAKASEAQDVRARFDVRPEQKLVVAAMSSYDEYVAARAIGEMPASPSELFPTQIEWVRALSEHFAKRPDLFLIIRVHPREFPNKREGTKSEHAYQLERAFQALPSNVRVNWPADKLSIYDLAEHADAFLNAWSTAGREMALLGLPVVAYCPEMLLYPAELNYVGTTRETYFAAIDKALRDGWSFERARRAFRWSVLELSRGIANIDDGFDLTEHPASSVFERAVRGVLALPGVRQRYDLWRRPHRLREAHRLGEAMICGEPTLVPPPVRTVDEATETAALRAQFVRLGRALAGDAPKPNTLGWRLLRS